MALIRIPPKTDDVENLFCVLTCHLYLLLDDMTHHVFCLFSNWIVCSLSVESLKLFVFSRHLYFVSIVVCEYFLPVYHLSFHPPGRVSCRAAEASIF